MSNNPKTPKKTSRGSSAKPAGSTPSKKAGRRPAAAAVAQQIASVAGEFFTDHTPPPLLFENGSIAIETDRPFTHDTSGTAHSHRHMTGPRRSVQGIRILNDSGGTIYIDEHAAGSTIKIWWDKRSDTEQILVHSGTFSVEAEIDLGGGSSIDHPPVATGNPPTKRIRRYIHPSTDNQGVDHGIEKVQVVKNGVSVFTETARLDRVMVWDTTDTP
jgi:hypothetical protein